MLPQQANPGYLTRRAAGAEHHPNPRRVRARPPGACRAAACRSRPAAGFPTPRRCAPAAAQPRICCPQGHAVPRLHGGGQVHARVTCGENRRKPRSSAPSPSGRAAPRSEPGAAGSPAAGAEQRCTCRHAAARPGRPAGRRGAPSRRRSAYLCAVGPTQLPARGQDEAPVNLTPPARSLARSPSAQGPRAPRPAHGRTAPPRRPHPAAARGGRERGRRVKRRPNWGGKEGGRGHRRGESRGRRRKEGGRGARTARPAPVASPAGISDSPYWRALPPPPLPPLPGVRPPPFPRKHRAAPRTPPSPCAAEQPLQEPGATGQGGAGRGGAPRSARLPPPPARRGHSLARAAAPSSPGAAAAGPRRLRSAAHVTGPLPRPRKGGLDVRSPQWGRRRRGPGRHGARGGGAPLRCPPTAAATGGREADALVSMTSAGGAAAFDGARRASGVGDFATSGSRGAGRGRGEAAVVSRPFVRGSRAASKGRRSPGGGRGRSPTREGWPPSGPGRVDRPAGRGPCAVPEPSQGRGRCRRKRRPEGPPGARGAVLPCPRGRGGAVLCCAVPCLPGPERCRPTASPFPEGSRWEPRWRLLSSGRGEHGGAWARLRCVCRVRCGRRSLLRGAAGGSGAAGASVSLAGD